MKKFPLILLLAAALLTAMSCSRKEDPSPEGTVTLSFRAGEPVTRSVSPGDGAVADGGGIYCTKDGEGKLHPDLYIFIFNRDTGVLEKCFKPDGTGDGIVDDSDSQFDGEKGSSTNLLVTFDIHDEGFYSVYAVANTGAGDSNLVFPDFAAISDISDLESEVISLSDSSSPNVGSRMPLSAKGVINVVEGLGSKYNGYVELQMLRCVSQVQFSFKNLTGEPLTLTNCRIKFKQLNTAQAWLIPHDSDFVELDDGPDSDTLDDNYRDYDSGTKTLSSLADEEERDYFASPVRFFPSVAPMQTKPSAGRRYLCDISFKIGGTSKSFTNLPIHNPKSQDIKSLSRNQYLHIVTTVSKGLNVSFNFKVNEWDEHHEYVEFN